MKMAAGRKTGAKNCEVEFWFDYVFCGIRSKTPHESEHELNTSEHKSNKGGSLVYYTSEYKWTQV